MNKKIYIDTLGCAKNDYDSQVLAAALLARGCELSESPEDADILIVNTCGFIESAKVESIEHIFDMARIKGDSKKLVVTGCLSQRYHEELSEEIPEVDIFTGVNDYDDLPSLLLADPDSADNAKGIEEEILPYRERLIPVNAHSAVLKIAEGCDNACTFCVIPSIRGKYRSKRIEDVLREANDMAKAGVKELILIAQDTSIYGTDLYGKPVLPELLREVCRVEGIEWIRLMYVYDNGITDELIETIASESKLCSYIDMPIQHISDNVLRRMARRSSKASITDTICHLRERIPEVHIRTTLLVGFPGETEEDFDELLDFLRSMKIERVGAFAFSDEEGTPAFGFQDKVPQAVGEARRDTLMELQMGISEELNSQKIGKVFEVIIDEITDDGVCIGRSMYDAPEIDNEISFVPCNNRKIGDIVRVKIIDAYEYDLIGEEV